MAYVYLITNNVNNKKYVGKTEQSIQKRFLEHCADSKKFSKRPLYRAMSKYGIDKFSISLLEETRCPEEREIFWIKELDSYHNGYNATLGGDGKKYLDYQSIYDTYVKLQNVTETAKVFNISVDSVSKAVKQFGEVKSAVLVAKDSQGKNICMFDANGNLEQIFPSVREAACFVQTANLTPSVSVSGVAKHIRDCANGVRKSAYTKAWKWQ